MLRHCILLLYCYYQILYTAISNCKEILRFLLNMFYRTRKNRARKTEIARRAGTVIKKENAIEDENGKNGTGKKSMKDAVIGSEGTVMIGVMKNQGELNGERQHGNVWNQNDQEDHGRDHEKEIKMMRKKKNMKEDD